MVLINMELPTGCEKCPALGLDEYGHHWICNIIGYYVEDPATGDAFEERPLSCPMMEYEERNDSQNRKTRFEQFKDCKEPEDMVMLLNGNERLFCPKGYVDKRADCTQPCGGCISSWLRQEVEH